MQKCLGLQKEYSDEKTDLAQEVAMIGTKLLGPAESAKQHTKLLHKTLKHRENMKLDYERYLSRAEHARKKQTRSAKEETALQQHEANLAQAQIDYETADDQVKQTFPPVSAAVLTLLPVLLANQVQLQTTLVGQLYTVLDGYTRKFGIPNPAPRNEDIISAWDSEFSSLRREIESGLQLVARGKVVHLSMELPAEKDKSTYTGLGIRNKTMGAFGKKETPLPNRPGRQISSSQEPQQQAIEYEEPAPPKPPRPGAAPATSPYGMPSPNVNMSSKPRIPSSASIPTNNNFNGTNNYPNHPPPPYPTGPTSPGYPTDTKGGATPPSRYQTPLNGLSTPLSLHQTTSNTSANNNNTDYFGAPAPLNVRKTSHTSATTPGTLNRLPSNTSIASSAASIAAKKKPPPPVPTKRIASNTGQQFVIALFDFEGQGPGDLAFREGDRIRVVRKTESVDDWWDGELGGVTGVFPANYVKFA